MIRLLIADDEKIIRETISSFIDWGSMNVEVVGVCKDGLEAYDAILDKYPDIVLTDIKMPKLSGLELIQRITQNHDNIQFIILSGYSEFSYAKEAMRYGIKHYILKPCNEQEIMDAVKEAIQEHYQKQILKALHQNALNSHFRETLLHDMLLQILSSNQNLSEIPAVYETYFDFYHTDCQLCYFFYLEEHLVNSCIEQLQTLSEENKIPYLFTYIYVKNTLLFFFMTPSKEDSHVDALLDGLTFPKQSTRYTYKRESFSSLLSLLETLRAKVKRYATIYLYSGTQAVTIYNYDTLFREIMNLSDLLLQESDETRYQEFLEDLNRLLLSVDNIEFLRSLANNLLLKIMKASSLYSLADILDFMVTLGSMTIQEDICSFLFQKLKQLHPSSNTGNETYKPFIQEILNYTNEHISSSELTLKWIVENHLFMNVDYVSRQFVLQTGVKFSTYLNEIRIKKAKELLLNCDTEKIYSVAEQIGCGNNPQYFSHLFKKYTKMTPKEYIQKIKNLDTAMKP